MQILVSGFRISASDEKRKQGVDRRKRLEYNPPALTTRALAAPTDRRNLTGQTICRATGNKIAFPERIQEAWLPPDVSAGDGDGSAL